MDEWVEDGQIRSKMLSLLETLDGDSAEAVDRLLSEFREMYTIYGGESFLQILDNLTDDSVQRTRILGSVALLLCNRDSHKAYRAIHNLHEGLMSEVEARRNFCLSWMFNLGCSGPASIPYLGQLISVDVPIEKPDTLRSWAAACVLDANDGQGEHAFVVAAAFKILRACMLHGDITSAIASGRAFIKHGKLSDRRKALQTLLDLYDAHELLDAKATILGQIGKFEVDSPRVRKILSEAALSNSHPVSFRTMALHAIHQLNSSRSWVDGVLLQVLASEDADLIWQSAIRLFDRHKSIPEEGWVMIIQFLHHHDRVMRQVAASLIGDLGRRHENAVSALWEQLLLETDQETLIRLIDAVAALGASIVQRAVSALEACDARNIPLIQTILFRVGETCIEEVVKTCFKSHNPIVRNAASAILHSLGPKAQDAIPIINEILTDVNSENLEDALNACTYMGPYAKDAAPELCKLLDHKDVSIQRLAEHVLENMGSFCIEPLLDHLPTTSMGSERAAKLLDRVEERFTRLASRSRDIHGITNRKELELFYWIARLLISNGKLSNRDISARLSGLKAESKIDSKLPSSESKIRQLIEKLEKQLTINTKSANPIRLIDRESRRKEGLTSFGKAFYQRIRNGLGAEIDPHFMPV
jgi:HEAT repeat protein